MRVLLTGGAGFIGSAVVRHLIGRTRHSVLNVDKLTYASSAQSLAPVAGHPRYAFRRCDICDGATLAGVFREFSPDAVMHLAAESHVDRSIHGPEDFIETNVVGTFHLLDEVRAHWMRLLGDEKEAFRFLHVSTDEVYGSLESKDSPFTDWKEARRYAGPLPFTFTYNKAKKEVLIIEGVRKDWDPKPIQINDHKIKFLDTLNLQNDAVLANAFIINNIPYYWKKGKTDRWKP